MDANFFWKGDGFTYVNYITVLSHIKVGHAPVLWISGNPKNEFIDRLKNRNDVVIKNADDVFDVTDFIESGGNFKTASALWRFNFLYEYGGLYCDTDAYAVKHFPDDDWILASAEGNYTVEYKGKECPMISIGVIKVPPKDDIFLDAINNIKSKWGNVNVFSLAYLKKYGNTNTSHPNRMFYPFTWDKWQRMFENNKIPDCYSVHLYHQMLEKNEKVITEEYNVPSMMLKLKQNVENV